MRTLRRRFLAVFLLAFAACDRAAVPSAPVAPPAAVRVEAVRITPRVVRLAGLGHSLRLTITFLPSDATDRAVRWESSDPRVVTVDSTGTITAVAPGDGVFVTAFAHDGHLESSSNVSVDP